MWRRAAWAATIMFGTLVSEGSPMALDQGNAGDIVFVGAFGADIEGCIGWASRRRHSSSEIDHEPGLMKVERIVAGAVSDAPNKDERNSFETRRWIGPSPSVEFNGEGESKIPNPRRWFIWERDVSWVLEDVAPRGNDVVAEAFLYRLPKCSRIREDATAYKNYWSWVITNIDKSNVDLAVQRPVFRFREFNEFELAFQPRASLRPHHDQLLISNSGLLSDFLIGVIDNDDVRHSCAKEQCGPRNEPPSESVNWYRLIEPPSSLLWRTLFFGAPGIALSVAGFVFLNGPHRRPNIGAALYCFGLLLFAVAALALA